MDYYDFPEYVPVKKRIANAEKQSKKLLGKGRAPDPVVIESKGVARSFWGKGWCDHMESFQDYENRLPRGRAYVRNGSVVHLAIVQGKVEAHVAGTQMYTVSLEVAALPRARWEELKRACAGQVASLVDLLQGKLADGVMQHVARRDGGLFPHPREIKLRCSCPDGARMCKHVAAVCYGVGARLDRAPELLFTLRGVDPAELATGVGVDAVLAKGGKSARARRLQGDLAAVFGLEPEEDTSNGQGKGETTSPAPKRPRAPMKKKPAATKKSAASKTPRAATPKPAATKKAEATKTKPANRKKAAPQDPAKPSPRAAAPAKQTTARAKTMAAPGKKTARNAAARPAAPKSNKAKTPSPKRGGRVQG